MKPQLNWKLATDESGPVNAEISYVTGGMTWDADYNVVAPENGDVLDLTAWVTLTNNSGKSFPDARIQLMAGDVQKVQPNRYGSKEFAAAAFCYALRATSALVRPASRRKISTNIIFTRWRARVLCATAKPSKSSSRGRRASRRN